MRIINCVFLSLILSGCFSFSLNDKQEAVKLSDIRGAPYGIETVRLEIPRSQLDAAFNQGAQVNKIRLIEIFAGAVRSKYPEYRIFDIQKTGVYELLGLKTGDVLVAANDYVIFDPSKFPIYVSLLKSEKTGQIEIRREQKPYLLQYSFID